MKDKILIGRSDKIDFPDLGLENVNVKIDTGAFTCSIHCDEWKVTGKNKKKLHFTVSHEDKIVEYTTSDFTERVIKNSSGVGEKRFIVLTKIIIFGKEYEAEFSLSDRSSMKHPVLLGRKFLSNLFLVDVCKFNLSYKEKNQRKKSD